MKKTTTATLLSALVIPGAGHLYLKKKRLGFGLIAIALISLSVLVVTAIEKVSLITDKILSGAIQPNSDAFTELVTSQFSSANTENVNLATAVFIIVWLIGIIDSYRIGRKQERIDNNAD